MKPSDKADREGEKPRAFWVGLALLVGGCLLLIIFFPQILSVFIPWYRLGDWRPYVPHATITVILIFAGLLMMRFKLKKPWVREPSAVPVSVQTAGFMARWGNTLWRVVVVFSCAVFLVSIFSPFLRADFAGFYIPGYETGFFSSWPGEMWSFKQIFFVWGPSGLAQPSGFVVFFSDYWLQYWGLGATSWTGYALMAMFVLQVLTVVSCFLVFVKNSRILIILPVAFSSPIVILASLIDGSLNGNLTRGTKLQLGFWLTLVSTIMFFIAVVAYFLTRTLQKRALSK